MASLEVEKVLAQIRQVLEQWEDTNTLGEVAIVRSHHQYQVEERPRRKLDAVKRVEGDSKAVVYRR